MILLEDEEEETVGKYIYDIYIYKYTHLKKTLSFSLFLSCSAFLIIGVTCNISIYIHIIYISLFSFLPYKELTD